MMGSTRKATARAADMLCILGCGFLLAAAAAPSPALAAQAQSAGPVAPASPSTSDAAEPGFAERMERAWQYHTIGQRIRDNLAPPQWLPAGDRFVIWASAGANAGTWVEVDARTGGQRPLIAPAEVKAQLSALLGKEAMLPPSMNIRLEPGADRLLFQNGGRPFALKLTEGRIVALAPEDPSAGTIGGGTIASPDGALFAQQKAGGFAIVDRTGQVLLERPGEQYWGWQVSPASWSPDGRLLVVARLDQRKVHKIPIVDYSGPIERVDMVPYVKSGTPLGQVEYHLVDPAAKNVTPIGGTADETYSWLAGWRPDGSEALLLRMSRDGKRLDLVAVDAKTAATRLVLREERPESFVAGLDFAASGWQSQVTPLKDNRRFLWMSERDGWRHLYLYDWSGKLERQVTRGRHVVHIVLGFVPGSSNLLVIASEDGAAPYDRLVYRADLRGGGLRRISAEPGDHQVTVSPSGLFYTDAHSSIERPRRSAVRSTDGRSSFEYAAADVSRLGEIGYAPPERLTAMAADGITPIHGVIYKPADFDSARHYPVINFVYGGPWINIAPRGFGGGAPMPAAAHAMAQLGFIVVFVDNRGTPGRGKAFQDVIYGRIGQTEIPDQIAALKQAAAARPWMDLDRVGIYGHSWGGYFALRGMLTAPHFYKAGYAGAPGAFEEAAIINEPYLGLPALNPQAWEAGSNPKLAGNLRGALKLMHGTSDSNASLSSSMLMADALIRANKYFDQLIMPNQPHSVTPPFIRYYFEDQMRFFTRHLGGPR